MKKTSIDVKSIIEDVLLTQEKAWPTYGTDEQMDRKMFLSASETTKCIRSLFMEKTVPADYDMADKQTWGFASRGNAAEMWLVDVLSEFFGPNELLFTGDNQRSFVWERLSATPDGILVLEDQTIYLEIKSIDPRAKLGGKPRPAHEAQVKQGMAVLKHNGFNCSHGVIIYLDANNYENIQQFEVKPDPSFVRQQVAKSHVLFDRVQRAIVHDEFWLEHAAALPPEGLTNGSKDCDYCPFTDECGRLNGSKVAPTDDLPDAPPQLPKFAPKSITRTVKRFRALKDECDDLSKQLDGLSDEIKSYMQDNSLKVLEAGTATAFMEHVAGRKTLDKAALAADGIDLSKYEKVGKPSLRLTVKAVEQ